MGNRLKNIFKPKVIPMNKIFIHSKNIIHNYEYLQSLQPGSVFFPVLKSNAYGHGLEQMTKILNKTDAPYLVVDSFPEYQIVKKNSKKNILILGETLNKNYKKFDFSRTTFCVYNIETIRYLAGLHRHIKIHLFLDTGMHREGVNEDELLNILEFLKMYPKIEIEGMMTHLYSADSIDNIGIQEQIDNFKKMYHTTIDYGYNPIRKHIGSSAGILKIKDRFFNAYRPGLYLYGYNNLSKEDKYFDLTKNLKPALSVNSKIISIHNIQKGDGVSYNKIWKAESDGNVATIPFGYFEGLPRVASNKIKFKHGKDYVNQVGNICMNLCCINAKCELFDDIEIIGLKGENSIDELANQSGMIIYEILVGLDKNIRREII